MSQNKTENTGTGNTRLITARQVQEEYLNIDIRRLRTFLNAYCHYRKIGRQYYYVREEVEQKLLQTDSHIEYQLTEKNYNHEIVQRRKK